MKLNLRLVVPLWFYLALYYNLVDATEDSIAKKQSYDELLEQLSEKLHYDKLYQSMKEKNEKEKASMKEMLQKVETETETETETINLKNELDSLTQIVNRSLEESRRHQEIIATIKVERLKKIITLESERVENTKSEIKKTEEVERKFNEKHKNKKQLEKQSQEFLDKKQLDKKQLDKKQLEQLEIDKIRAEEFLESRLRYLNHYLKIYEDQLENKIKEKEKEEQRIQDYKNSSSLCACLGIVGEHMIK